MSLISSGQVFAKGQMLQLGSAIPFDDEFNQSIDLLNNNTSAWQVLGAGQMDERASEMQIGGGLLTVVPDVIHHNGWFQDDYGPLIYQEVTGNFSVVLNLRVSAGDDVDLPPDVGFNAAGFVIRNASGTHNQDENWVMYNMGGQGQNGVTFAREMKKTVNSVSNLFLTEQVHMEEYLLACRIGGDFYFYYWADAIQDWRQETFYNNHDVDGVSTTTWRNNNNVTPEIIAPGDGQANPMYFNHDGMSETIQLGIMSHTWDNNGVGSGSRGDFEFIRFAANPPQSQSDCTSAFPQLGNDLIFEDGFELLTD
ncbi:hypothetical protein [Marinicella rhabdoformis]|uniref:hypothetical protein n=1 Tax=Marinicella rhabdoformis TaxID=2580566 RepID=UPI0012AECCAC|nr:hypothetical protein [Marinicella rhabdoformis]